MDKITHYSTIIIITSDFSVENLTVKYIRIKYVLTIILLKEYNSIKEMIA